MLVFTFVRMDGTRAQWDSTLSHAPFLIAVGIALHVTLILLECSKVSCMCGHTALHEQTE